MSQTSLTILSFNIWDLPVSFLKSRKARMEAVIRYLSSTTADIIFLQEVWFADTQALIRQALGTTYHEARSYISKKNKGFSRLQGGLMLFSKFPLRETNFNPFSLVLWPLTECIGGKGILTTKATTPFGTVRLSNLHLYEYNKSRRFKQLVEACASFSKNIPTIFAGDFNQPRMWEEKKFAKVLRTIGFREPRDVASSSLITHRLENIYAQAWSNGATEPQQRDYILISDLEPLGLIPKAYYSEYEDPPLSDHDALYLKLEFQS